MDIKIKNLLLLVALWYLGDMVAYACTVQTIVTDRGVVSCYICPDLPTYCTKI
jgi:hypothetical protein